MTELNFTDLHLGAVGLPDDGSSMSDVSAISNVSNKTFVTEESSLVLETFEKGDISRLCSHWSSSYITALSLVESFIVMLRHLSYAIKNQIKAQHFLPFVCSLWHRDRWLPCKERI